MTISMNKPWITVFIIHHRTTPSRSSM